MAKVNKFKGAGYFRQRIVCSTLSGQAILIREIREREEKPGLTEYEASLLRLIEKVTNGCVIEIDHTGTQVYYKPGAIVGGRVTHDCGRDRAVGYFLEALVCLAPFGKEPLIANLTGITNHHNNLDISVDLFRTVTLPQLRHFGVSDGLQFKILKRGAPPNGGGEVEFKCPIVKALKPIQLTSDAKVKRVRGIAYTARVSPQFANRMVESSKGTLLKFTSDVFIYTDHYKSKESGSSPGFGLSLVAETTAGTLFSAETMGTAGVLPEDIASESCQLLMQELMMGGAVDTMHQPMTFLLMTLSPEDISKVRIGKLSPYSIEMLRNIRKFFGVTFKIEPDVESKTVILTCLGIGFNNMSRRVI